MFIDTHAHLNFKAFRDDLDQVIDRARKADVTKIINVGSNLPSSLRAVEIAKKYQGLFAAAALHPIYAANKDLNLSEFQKIANNPIVVAIGETGLDYYHLRNDKLEIINDKLITEDQTSIGEKKEKQKDVFEDFLHLARQINKPVIIHNREATDDILEILSLPKFQGTKGVIHCFSSSQKSARHFLELGYLISFTGVITYTNQYDKTIAETPLEKMMIETDCPYLAPEPYRGQQNEPAYVVEIAKKIAQIKKIDLSKVETQTTKNAEELFGI